MLSVYHSEHASLQRVRVLRLLSLDLLRESLLCQVARSEAVADATVLESHGFLVLELELADDGGLAGISRRELLPVNVLIAACTDDLPAAKLDFAVCEELGTLDVEPE